MTPPAHSVPDLDKSIFQVQLRSGVWGVKLDGAFFGDYHAISDAMGNVLERARTLQSAGRTVQVEITKFTFAPKEITVAPGTRVIWINHDETPHTVAANDKSFGSKGLDTDDKFERVFAQEGDFGYICTVHPFMTGVVHVHK